MISYMGLSPMGVIVTAEASNELERSVYQQLVRLLNGARAVMDLSLAPFYCKAEPRDHFSAGQMMIVPSGQCFVDISAYPKMLEELDRIGLQVEDTVNGAAGSGTSVLFTCLNSANDAETTVCRYAAPWYADLYRKSISHMPEVAAILSEAARAQEVDTQIFRGEPDIYPAVLSTLARYWGTDSAAGLKVLTDRDIRVARKYITESSYTDLELLMEIQHMGGKTNLVDFTLDVWVALFFACLDTRDRPKKDTAGRVHALERTAMAELDGRLAYDPFKPDTSSRQWSQASVLLQPGTGIIPPLMLAEIVRVPPHCKEHVMQFLRQIGVTLESLFNDMAGYIAHEQVHIPHEAIFHIAFRHIQTGAHPQAEAYADVYLNRTDPVLDHAVGHYLRGLNYAAQGRLKDAHDDLKKCVDIRQKANLGIPSYVEQNRTLVAIALARVGNKPNSSAASHACFQLRKRLVLEAGSELWSITLGEYTLRNP